MKTLPTDRPDAPQFSLRDLFVLTAAFALVFALGQWLAAYGGLILAIPLTVLPLCILIEYVFGRARHLPAPIAIPAPAGGWRHSADVAGTIIAASCAAIAISAGTPTLFSPLPLLVVLPLLLGLPWLVVVAIPAATFLALDYCPERKANRHFVPLRYPVLLAIATASSAYWFASSVQYSYGYHGATYTMGIAMINAAAICLLWGGLLFLRRRASYWLTFLWRLALICWLFWLAFPWLGEMI